MKKILLLLSFAGVMSGCSFIIGKHPGVDARASGVYCFPCVDVEGKGGGGLAWVRNRPVLGYRYSDFKGAE